MTDLSVLIVAPNLDGADVGESYTALRLLSEMASHLQLTVLAYECRYGPPLAEQLPDAEVITFEEPSWARRGNFAHLFKPGVPLFHRRVRQWVKEAQREGRHFDLAHQILPRAPRYASPFRGLGLPYVIGSLGGALPTPPAFAPETGSASWYTRLRKLDALRFRYDPSLRASYSRANLVLGVAPYMREILADVPMRRFEPFLGIGIDSLPDQSAPATPAKPGEFRLLHVGRGVRTKGLRDTVRALGQLPDLPGVTLTSIGDGEEIPHCRAEAEALGLGDRVRFLGRLPRDEIEAHYRDSDVLVFPSFRESMGGVLYEAMRWRLPVITVDYGGPGHIVDDSCAIRLPVTTPEALARDLSTAIRNLHDDPERRLRMGEAAREKVAAEGLWSAKAERMIGLYQSITVAREGEQI